MLLPLVLQEYALIISTVVVYTVFHIIREKALCRPTCCCVKLLGVNKYDTKMQTTTVVLLLSVLSMPYT